MPPNEPGPQIEMYMDEMGKIPLLCKDDTMELARIVQAKGPNADLAKSILVQANLRLVVSVAKQNLTKGLSLEDLIQEGNLGLILAAERFDPTRGIAFSTYAQYWINREIQEALRKARPLRISKYEMTYIHKVWRAIKVWREAKKQEPTEDELKKALEGENIPPYLFELALRPERCIPFDTPDQEGDARTLADLLPDGAESPEVAADRASIQRAVRKAIGKLPEKERRATQLLYGIGDASNPDPLSDQAVGAAMGVSRTTAQNYRLAAAGELKAALQAAN